MTNHLGNTNKMVSDTPRADAVDAKCDELELKDAVFYAIFHFEKLEREFNAANERIKRLEEALAWYESTVSDCNRHGPQGDAARHALAQDRGIKAKEAKL